MNIVTRKAKKRQRIIEYSLKHGKNAASRKYKEPLSNIKRWIKRYDGTWQSLKDKSRHPHSHPKQHTIFEEAIITEVWQEHGRKGIDYVYCILVQEKGYTRSQGGLFHALRRLGLIEKPKKKGRRNYRQCTACEIPGEKVQIDVKVETFRETDEANKKLKEHMKWTNNKPMRIFKGKSPMQKLEDYIWLI